MLDLGAVLDLGAMGSAIARTFVERGYRTTVCNRTASRSAPLVAAGATAAAMAASPPVVVCLLDGTAVDEILGSVDAAVAGRALVNPTSGSPAQARAERVAGSLAAHQLLTAIAKTVASGTAHRLSVRSASRSRW
ncbi:NAD(P)-binding domain-containing protein [Actinomadura sp. NPDC047616]|uniref:NAD(P)-binding domain-containing protein n=1 Tax=Actinomadura sp. NPDC047616 TaxID=3155914 RepID=UPI0033BFBB93